MKTYQVSLTKKGQMTIPKEVREKLDLQKGRKAEIKLDEESGSIKISQPKDIMEFAGNLEAPEGKDPLKGREEMEENYERV